LPEKFYGVVSRSLGFNNVPKRERRGRVIVREVKKFKKKMKKTEGADLGLLMRWVFPTSEGVKKLVSHKIT